MADDFKRELVPGRYFNSNGFAVSIVAAVNTYQGEILDWCAYIAGTDQTFHEEDAHEWAAEWGDKMRQEDAHHFFPYLPIEKWRP